MPKVKTWLILISIVFGAPKVIAASTCETRDQFNDLKAGMEHLTAAAIIENIPRFCRSHAFYSHQENGIGAERDYLNELTESKEKFYKNFTPNNPWAAGMVPVLESRKKSILALLPDRLNIEPDINNLKSILAESTSSMSSSQAENVKKSLNEMRNPTVKNSERSKYNEFVLAGGCATTSLRSMNTCSKIVAKNLGGTNVLLGQIEFPEFEDIFLDKRYEVALRAVGVKIIDQIKTGNIPKTNLFDDLKSEFKKSSKSPTEADDMAWLVMGFLSRRGANADDSATGLGYPKNHAMTAALYAISMGSLVLDSQSNDNGHMYSFPSQVQNSCDMGKPYHFWMSAYIARKAMKDTGDPVASSAAAFTMQKGYEFLSNTFGRSPAKPFYLEPFDPYINVIRADLAYGGTGAWFGVLSAQGKAADAQLSIDDGIRETFLNSKMIARVTKEEAKSNVIDPGPITFYKWSTLISPNSAYSLNRKKLGY